MSCRVNVLIEDDKNNKCTFTFTDNTTDVFEVCTDMISHLGLTLSDCKYIEVQNDK